MSHAYSWEKELTAEGKEGAKVPRGQHRVVHSERREEWAELKSEMLPGPHRQDLVGTVSFLLKTVGSHEAF